MSLTIEQVDQPAGSNQAARDALLAWTLARLPAAGAVWLQEVLEDAHQTRRVDIAFGMAARKAGRAPVNLSTDEQEHARMLIEGWQAQRLRIDEAARLLIALAGLEHDPNTLQRLVRHADVDEQCALYRGLCIVPECIDLHDIVGRGLRTHANPVFESIAHHNPWVATHFDDHRWNHLVLKAMFMEVSLWPIHAFDERRNTELSRMALDFAAERQAAERPVPDELFRCVAPFARLDDIVHFMPAEHDGDQHWPDTAATRALSLSLHEAADPALRAYIGARSPHLHAISDGTLCWSTFSSMTQRT